MSCSVKPRQYIAHSRIHTKQTKISNLFRLTQVHVPGKIPLLSTEQTNEITDYAKQFSYQRNHDTRFPTMWCVRPAKAQTSLRICAV